VIEGESALLEIKTLPSMNKLTAIDSFEKAMSEKKVGVAFHEEVPTPCALWLDRCRYLICPTAERVVID